VLCPRKFPEIRLTDERWQASGGSQIYAFGWDYDAVGNRSIEYQGGATHRYYTYDAANQLTGWNDAPGVGSYEGFAYDERGNCIRIDKPGGLAVYFEYNDVNLVTSIRYTDGTMNYFSYDAFMRRFAVQEASGLSYFTWDQNGMNLLCERDASGSVTAYYTHGYSDVDGIGSLVGAKRNEAGASYYQYPVYDHRGSVVRLLDENGTPTAYFEYDAWGTQLESNVVGGTGTNRFRYQSNWIKLNDDPDGDIYHSGTRLYHAGVGRYLGRDALGALAGGYLYTGDRPVQRVDNNGLASTDTKAAAEDEKALFEDVLIHVAAKFSEIPLSYMRGIVRRHYPKAKAFARSYPWALGAKEKREVERLTLKYARSSGMSMEVYQAYQLYQGKISTADELTYWLRLLKYYQPQKARVSGWDWVLDIAHKSDIAMTRAYSEVVARRKKSQPQRMADYIVRQLQKEGEFKILESAAVFLLGLMLDCRLGCKKLTKAQIETIRKQVKPIIGRMQRMSGITYGEERRAHHLALDLTEDCGYWGPSKLKPQKFPDPKVFESSICFIKCMQPKTAEALIKAAVGQGQAELVALIGGMIAKLMTVATAATIMVKVWYCIGKCNPEYAVWRINEP